MIEMENVYMPRVDLIAIDMDGTLLNPDHKVTPAVKEAIQEAKDAGIKIVLCTGRPFPGVTDYLEELDLKQEGDYAITYNGALVQRTDTKEVVANHTMNHHDYLKLQAAAKDAGVHFHAIHNQGIFTPNTDISEYSVVESYINGVPLFYRTPEEMDEHTSYNKMMMIDKEEILDAGIAKLSKSLWDEYTILRSEAFFLEFLNKDASKGTALKDLATILGFPKERVMAIGDSGNDIDLIEYAGIGVAMGNAVDAVKDVADAFTTSNTEDGVAEAIRRFAL
jgi:hypothetical protein